MRTGRCGGSKAQKALLQGRCSRGLARWQQPLQPLTPHCGKPSPHTLLPAHLPAHTARRHPSSPRALPGDSSAGCPQKGPK